MENFLKRQEVPTNGIQMVEVVDSSMWSRADIIGLVVGLTGIVITVALTVTLICYAKKLDKYAKISLKEIVNENINKALKDREVLDESVGGGEN